MNMRTDFDFAPLYRATVGFDRVFNMLDSMAQQPTGSGYPPYNIEKTGDDHWRIVIAVAGFSDAELNVTQKEDELLVTGKGRNNRDDQTEYLYRGIGGRDFERRFQLADHVRVTSAQLTNGLLSIDLQRELPEEKKPRTIRVTAEAAPQRITQQ
jgi:molecular chaperone IbpA